MKLLLLDIFSDEKALREKYNTAQEAYQTTLSNILGIDENKIKVVNAWTENLPNPAQFSGIIIGGSLHNPTEAEEKLWMKKLCVFIQKASEADTPMLGICGGHEFIAHALGGNIVRNPKGRVFGTVTIAMTKDGAKDPLFKGIPETFVSQASHSFVIEGVRQGWKLLASSSVCDVQAVAIGDTIRIVQFHPEFEIRHMKNIARVRNYSIENVEETPYVKQILKNFLKYFVLVPKKRNTSFT